MAKIYDGYSNKEPNANREIGTIRPEIAKARFLELFMLTGHMGRTCAILGLVPRTVNHWRTHDEQFKNNFLAASEIVLQLLEDEVVRRAVHGVQKPVYQGGKLVGYVMEYSDTLLLKLLKSRSPERWGDKFLDNNGAVLGTVEIVHKHTGLQLASSEDQINYRTGSTEDIQFQEIPPQQDQADSKQLDSLD